METEEKRRWCVDRAIELCRKAMDTSYSEDTVIKIAKKFEKYITRGK